MAYQEDKGMLEKRTFRPKRGNQAAYKKFICLRDKHLRVFCLHEEISYNSGKR